MVDKIRVMIQWGKMSILSSVSSGGSEKLPQLLVRDVLVQTHYSSGVRNYQSCWFGMYWFNCITLLEWETTRVAGSGCIGSIALLFWSEKLPELLVRDVLVQTHYSSGARNYQSCWFGMYWFNCITLLEWETTRAAGSGCIGSIALLFWGEKIRKTLVRTLVV